MTSAQNWLTQYPVYQIDFAAAAAGKRVAATKRRIRWRFGFPNRAALEAGQTGTECRGEEHDITVVWSITSGKRQVSMDGREIHYSTSRAGVLDFSWSTKGNHVIKVTCHAAAPMSPTPGFRQYELLIDGQSFFRMPKVYELGIKGSVPSHAGAGYGGGYSNPTSPISMDSGARFSAGPSSRAQEEQDLRRAIQASIEESRQHLSRGGIDDRSAYTAPPAQATADLLDFDGPPAPAGPAIAPAPYQTPADTRSVASYYSAPPPSHSQGAPPQPTGFQSPQPGALVPSHGPPGSYYGAPPAQHPPAPGYPPAGYASPHPVPPAPAPTPTQPYYGQPPAAPPVQNGVFGLNSPPGEDPFAPRPPPPPPPQDLASVILGAYQSPPATPAGAAGAPNQFSPSGQPTQDQNGEQGAAVPMSMGTLVSTQEEPKSEFDSALSKLVNIDHIDEPAEGERKLTMMKEEEKKKAPNGKSKPVPPKGDTIFGKNATLGQMKETSGTTLKHDTEGIMKNPPAHLFQNGAANAGALVVHGQGPPPLHQAQGFGVGAQLPNGGFGQQQQVPLGYHTPQFR